MLRHIVVVVFDGCQIMDFSGPISVFSAANDELPEPLYVITLVSGSGGVIVTDSGISILTKDLNSLQTNGLEQNIDTILVSGGFEEAITKQLKDQALLAWLVKQERKTRRMSSVCSGSFILAKAGLLTGKKAATHWSACAQLGKNYPQVNVDENALFVVDGKIWTSAGVTTGIDMALAMVEQDTSIAIANLVAQKLVLYTRRPGHQTQFSPFLQVQFNGGKVFKALLDWMSSNLANNLDVQTLADQCNMSERTFYRRFTDSTGMTPGSFVLRLRLDHARALLTKNAKLQRIATTTGFKSVSHLSSAFTRQFGIPISVYRSMHHVT